MGRLRYLQDHRTGNPGCLFQSDKYFYIRDAGIYLRSSADGTLDIVSDTTLNLTAPTLNLAATTITTSGSTTNKQPVISGSGATVTLTAAQSGSLALFNRAAGIVYTLPTPAVGLWYDFFATVTVTSNAATVITATPASQFLLGSLVNIDTDTTNAVAAWTANGTDIVKIASNGTTTGILGSMYRLTAVSTTIWMVQGMLLGNGTVATPFATA